MKKIYIKHNTLIVKLASIFMRVKKDECLATTIGSTIHLLNITPEEFLKKKSFVRHEIQHVIQFQTIRFFRLKYIWQTITKGYKNNKYEIEAENNKYSEIPDGLVIVYESI